jgi:hypothetical protein
MTTEVQTTVSTAAQVILAIIPIVGIIMGSVVMFVYLAGSFSVRRQMIEKGISQKNPFDLDTFSLFAGLLCSSIGVALVIFFLVKEGASYGLLGGLIPFAIGFGLIFFYVIRLKVKKQ